MPKSRHPLNVSRIYYVYKLVRPWNGRICYVGKGKGSRHKSHQTNLTKGLSKNPHLRRIFEKAGGKLPSLIIRDRLTEVEAFRIETDLITTIGRTPNGPLANLTDGGEGPSGYKFTPEQRERQAEHLRRLEEKRTPEERRANGIKGVKNGLAKATKEQRSEWGKLGGLASSKAISQEDKRKRGRKGGLARMADVSFEERQRMGRHMGLKYAAETTLEQKQERARANGLHLTALRQSPEQHRARALKAHSKKTPEQETERALKAWKTRRENLQKKTES